MLRQNNTFSAVFQFIFEIQYTLCYYIEKKERLILTTNKNEKLKKNYLRKPNSE